MRRHTSKRFLFKELCYFALAASLALLLAGAVTNVVKIFTGRLRPDYLNRCFPSKFKKGQLPMIDLAQVVQSPTPKCEMYNYAVIDGRKSFPSGHSSYLAAVCVCSALYVHRVVQLVRLYRAKVSGRDADTPNPTASSLAARIVGLRVNLIDIFTSPGFTFCVCLSVATVIPAWAAASRITDRRHHPSDVFAGLLIGSVLGIVSFHLYFSRSHSFLNYPPAPSTKVFEALSSSAPPATTEATAPLTAKTL